MYRNTSVDQQSSSGQRYINIAGSNQKSTRRLGTLRSAVFAGTRICVQVPVEVGQDAPRPTSASLREPFTQALIHLGGARLSLSARGALLGGNADGARGIFEATMRVLAWPMCPEHLKRPCATLVWSVGRTINTNPAAGLPKAGGEVSVSSPSNMRFASLLPAEAEV